MDGAAPFDPADGADGGRAAGRGGLVRGGGAADRAVWALGLSVGIGALLGLVWLAVAPRPEARWTGEFWLAAADVDFSAVQDIWFGLLNSAAGIGVGIALTVWSGRAGAWRRAGLWFGGGLLGPAVCLLVGSAAGGGFGGAAGLGAEVGAEVTAPLTLTSPGLLVVWVFAAGLVVVAALGARAVYGRTW
ncbi:MAG: hypothetical protein LBO20_00980 [Bifidobacteriaceae bacterium]|jgi:hypothetical protein|nr:hypothetical protein [Bifidobacteriaceae bacterium]